MRQYTDLTKAFFTVSVTLQHVVSVREIAMTNKKCNLNDNYNQSVILWPTVPNLSTAHIAHCTDGAATLGTTSRTELRPKQASNVEIAARNYFTLLGKVRLSLG